MFQSLGWVERLSDLLSAFCSPMICCFNPSDGLSVFQTPLGGLATQKRYTFQSLGWVERLSDDLTPNDLLNIAKFQSLGWVERLSDLLRP